MFKIVIPCFNAENYIGKCIGSIQSQTIKDFDAVIINDGSTDRTKEIALEAISNDSRFSIINSQINTCPLSSTVSGIKHLAPDENDIVAMIDGDDMLNITKALEIVKKTYERTDCLITYGNYVTQRGKTINPRIGKRHQQRVIDQNLYRKAHFISHHLKTFKHILYSKIDPRDLRDSDGNFWSTCSDLALMFPMLEMAGDRQEAISDPIYRYSYNLPTNVDFTKRDEQLRNDKALRNMEPYKKQIFEN